MSYNFPRLLYNLHRYALQFPSVLEQFHRVGSGVVREGNDFLPQNLANLQSETLRLLTQIPFLSDSIYCSFLLRYIALFNEDVLFLF